MVVVLGVKASWCTPRVDMNPDVEASTLVDCVMGQSRPSASRQNKTGEASLLDQMVVLPF